MYFFLFYIEFLVLVFTQKRYLQLAMAVVCLCSQLFFFVIESIQIKSRGFRKYFADGFWNIIELTQFLVSAAYFGYMCHYDFEIH